jgi:HSP20 family protein
MFSLIPWKRNRGEGALQSALDNPFELMHREFDSVFDRFFGGWPLAKPEEMARAWGVDWMENEKEWVLRAELPGFELSEIDVHVAGKVLTITAEHKATEDGAGDKIRQHQQMKGVFSLPQGVTAENVEATYRNGVLEVHLPKLPEAQPRKIEVKA